MSGFLYRLRAGMTRMMQGRHGVDQLSIALVYAALACNLLALIPYLGILTFFSLLMIAYGIFRIFSRNHQKRYAENAWFLKHFGGIPGQVKQTYQRFKNRRQFVYFDCPNCKAKLRLPRGVGEVNVTCGKCGHVTRKAA